MTNHTKTANTSYTATKTANVWRSNYPIESRVFTKAANRQRSSGKQEKTGMKVLEPITLADGLEYTPIDQDAPLAPVKLVTVSYSRYPYWRVIRCPYCDDIHEHGSGEGDGDPRRYLGGRVAHCHPDLHNGQGILGRPAEYRLVAIEGNPTKAELDEHFPLVRGPRGIHRLYIDRPEPRRVAFTADDRAAAWEKSHGFCWYCGDRLNPFRSFTIDHVTPVADGGTNDPANLVPCCPTCNSAKGAMALEMFRQRRGGGLFWFESVRGRS